MGDATQVAYQIEKQLQGKYFTKPYLTNIQKGDKSAIDFTKEKSIERLGTKPRFLPIGHLVHLILPL
jgi:hypothetical protein